MERIRKAKPEDAADIWRIRTSAIRLVCSSASRPEEVDARATSPMPPGFGQIVFHHPSGLKLESVRMEKRIG